MTIVRKTLADLPPISPERAAELRAMAERPDSEIDLGEAPELDAEGWRNAIPGKFFRPLKTQINIRVDKDVLHWLKSGGSGYQSRLNAILREAMVREQKDETARQPKAEAISA